MSENNEKDYLVKSVEKRLSSSRQFKSQNLGKSNSQRGSSGMRGLDSMQEWPQVALELRVVFLANLKVVLLFINLII